MSRFTRIRYNGTGHRFWKDTRTGRIAVSDESGDRRGRCGGTVAGTPDQCDDGVLYLDPTRAIVPGENGSFAIPLTDEQGGKGATIAGLTEALWVASNFRMEIRSEGYGFYVESPAGGLPAPGAVDEEACEGYGA